MFFADSESASWPKDHGKQNLNEPYSRKYEKQVAWTNGFELIYVDDNFGQPIKSYLGEDSVYNFINSMFQRTNTAVVL